MLLIIIVLLVILMLLVALSLLTTMLICAFLPIAPIAVSKSTPAPNCSTALPTHPSNSISLSHCRTICGPSCRPTQVQLDSLILWFMTMYFSSSLIGFMQVLGYIAVTSRIMYQELNYLEEKYVILAGSTISSARNGGEDRRHHRNATLLGAQSRCISDRVTSIQALSSSLLAFTS